MTKDNDVNLSKVITESSVTSNSFDQKLADKIKTEKIKPHPRWHFLLKDYVVWGLGFISLLVGALAVAVMIYLMKYGGWELSGARHQNIWEFLLLNLPYFWLVFFGLFIFLLYYNLRQTRGGYRYSLWLVITASLFFNLLLGGVFFAAGWGEKIDDILGRQAPFYDEVINRQMRFWRQPEAGRIAGIIERLYDGQSLGLIDQRQEVWEILIETHDPLLNKLQLGDPVHLVGQDLGEHKFMAEMIMPARSGREFLRRPGLPNRNRPCSGELKNSLQCPPPRF